MASSLAAAIEKTFGITAELLEGHDGIYEVAINGHTVYTNQKKCGQLPEKEEILQEIRKYKDPLPEADMQGNALHRESMAPSCPWPPSSGNQTDEEMAVSKEKEDRPTCCGSSEVTIEPVPGESDKCCS